MISVTQTRHLMCTESLWKVNLLLANVDSKKEMFLCLISLPRILREDVSTNIKDMVWTTPAIPNHLPSPPPLANLMSLPLLVSDLPRFV